MCVCVRVSVCVCVRRVCVCVSGCACVCDDSHYSVGRHVYGLYLGNCRAAIPVYATPATRVLHKELTQYYSGNGTSRPNMVLM